MKYRTDKARGGRNQAAADHSESASKTSEPNVWVDNRASSVAQRNIQAVFENHTRSTSLLQRRYDNPDPAASSSDDDRFADVTLSEHHVVPYSNLLAFLDAYRAAANNEEAEGGNPAFTNLADFLPENADMNSTKLEALNIITRQAKAAIDDAGTTPQEWLELDAEEKNEIIDGIEGAPHIRTRARRSLDNWAKTMNATRTGEEVDGVEPSADLILSYTTWAKGNLFVGPEGAVRTWDPGDGFDTWAQYFIPEEHYTTLNNINTALATATAALGGDEPDLEAEQVATVLENLQTLATTYNNATDFDPDAWVKPEGAETWQPSALE